MNHVIEILALTLIIGAAAYYLVATFIKKMKNKGCGGDCGCKAKLMKK